MGPDLFCVKCPLQAILQCSELLPPSQIVGDFGIVRYIVFSMYLDIRT